ncbi:flavin reductase family protein [Chitinivorax sp. B]|uniref:flavin reductase family protein n=1 Tax=Chitinivorax sp. B TaxID=2502235 RepID=UPI0010F686EC|nr:flavin reductase family protein [Chitinivorax sp. B]
MTTLGQTIETGTMPAPLDSRALRRVLSQFATGVAIVATQAGDAQPVGLTINSFSSVSLDPPLVLWSLSRQSGLLPIFQATGHFAISILNHQQSVLGRHFATAPGNRFTSVPHRLMLHDQPVVDDVLAWFVCANRRQYVEGDHVIFIGEVLQCERMTTTQPLLFWNGDMNPFCIDQPAMASQVTI